MTALPYPELISAQSNVGIQDNGFTIDLGDGYQQAGFSGINTEYELWSVVWPALNDTQFAALKSTLTTVGSVTPMTWNSPLDGVSKKYRVVQNSRKIQSVGAKWQVTVSLRQVFEP